MATGDVVSIHISAKQSLTSEHASAAARDGANEFAQLRLEADGLGVPNIRIVDSKSDSVGLGLLVVFASRMIERGLAIDEIVARLAAEHPDLDVVVVAFGQLGDQATFDDNPQAAAEVALSVLCDQA